jgi:phosphoglycolate phosphatase-like HAD superfamily hydrolase/predicted metalloenzyme YecM
MSVATIFGNPVPTIQVILDELISLGFDLSNQNSFTIDHLCYKPSTLTLYENYKQQLQQYSLLLLLTETMINGRPIATYKLHEPIQVGHFHIPLFELPAPKLHGDQSTYDHYDHIEIVVHQESLQDLHKRFSHLEWNLSNKDKIINPDITLRLKSGLVKFHPSSLEEVIKKEILSFHQKNRSRAVVFDLDGTLVSTAKAFRWAIKDLLTTTQDKHFTIEEIESSMAPSFDQVFSRLHIPPSEHGKLISLFSQSFQKYIHECDVFEGIRTILAVLKSQGVDLVLWTAREKESTLAILEQHELAHYFSFVQYYEMGNKPHPSEEIKSHLKPFKDIVMIGDSLSDVHSAQSLKVPFIHIDSLRTPATIYQFLCGYL